MNPKDPARSRPLQPLYQTFRRDWTQLSFGLFLAVGVLYGAIDQQADPSLTPFVLLPPVIIVLGALAYSLSGGKAQRSLAMLISLALAVRASGPRETLLR